MLIAGLAAAGVALNFLPLRLFFQVDFLFGSIATMLICRLYGGGWGLLGGLIVALPTYWLWGHPYAIIILGLEGAAAGFLHRRRGWFLVPANAVYWMVLGMPLVLLFYQGVMGMPGESGTLIMLKQALNGVANALLANVIFLAAARLRPPRDSSIRPPLLEWVFTGASLLVLGPVLLFIVLESRQTLRQVEDGVRDLVASALNSTSRQVSYWYHRHLFVLRDFARIAEERFDDAELLQAESERLRRLFPDFAAVYVADAGATARAFAPATNPSGGSNIGSNFSHRDYYRKVAETGEPVVSRVEMGQGAVLAPMQTISVPVMIDGAFAGYVCGVLNLDYLAGLLRTPDLGGVEITLLDERDRVLAATLPAHRALTHFTELAPGDYSDIRPALYLRTPSGGGPEMRRWANSFYGHRRALGAEWPVTVVAEISVSPFQERLYRHYISSLLIGLGSLALAGGVALLMSRMLARPITALVRATSSPRPEEPSEEEWPVCHTAELNLLSGNFQRTLAALRETVASLRQQSGELARKNEELREAQQERARYAETLELQVAERTHHLQQSIRELESFSYSVSHDLRAPLRAMAGYSEFLLDEFSGVLDENGRSYLARIRESAASMDHLINDLLEYSRLNNAALPIQSLDPGPVLQGVLRNHAAAIGARGASVVSPAKFPRVAANPLALEQVFGNLLANAVKFVPDGRRPEITITAEPRDHYVLFSVADNGIGIRLEHQKHIFGLFHRLHPAGEFEGTGVGLAIVRKALERMGGRVWVKSEPGAGSTFYFELPSPRE